MPLPRKERTLELSVSEGIITDFLNDYLHRINVLFDNEEVLKLVVDTKGGYKLKVTYIEERQPEVYIHK